MLTFIQFIIFYQYERRRTSSASLISREMWEGFIKLAAGLPAVMEVLLFISLCRWTEFQPRCYLSRTEKKPGGYKAFYCNPRKYF